MGNVLQRIMATKREEIARDQGLRPASELRARLADAPPVRDFFASVSAPGEVRVIAEVKKASPSKGVIRADFDPVGIATIYSQCGAAGISVLTDEQYFQGSLSYLRAIRAAVETPLLRKEFILDPYQVLEAREAGADAVLLIAECLDDDQLPRLVDCIHDFGMTPLLELYDPHNVDRVLKTAAKLIGVNNRDLRTFETSLEHTVRLRKQLGADRAVVGESGIRTRADVEHLAAAGVQAILVGETFMAAPDIAAAVKTLVGVPIPQGV